MVKSSSEDEGEEKKKKHNQAPATGRNIVHHLERVRKISHRDLLVKDF